MNRCSRFCGEHECNETQKEDPMLCKRVTDKLHEEKPSEEFKFWYERFFLQSPRLASLQYDDEKMWEAWKAGYNQTKKEVDNA